MFEEGKTKGNVKRSAESVQKPKTPPPGQATTGEADADKTEHPACPGRSAKGLLGDARLMERNMKLKKNDKLQTPEYIIDALGPFDLDPCAGIDTNIGKINYCIDLGQNGLDLEWNGFVWCNPPFSQKEIWAKKMVKHGNGILILPERGSAPWFGPLAEQAGKYFVMGKKINFIGGPSSNNLGSVLFPFGKLAIDRINKSGFPGHLVDVTWYKPRFT